MTVTVFTPAHITGFFTIENNSDPMKNGSCGAGFLLDKGVKTTIKNSKNFKFNTNKGNNLIINNVLKYFKCDKDFEIIQDIQVPIGAGFGTSAASALSSTLALNDFLNYGYSHTECGQIAHEVELSIGGGLGDVIAQTGYGLVLRKKPGAPGIGEIECFAEDIWVGVKSFSPINTSSVIGDKSYRKNICRIGQNCLNEFIRDYSIDNFVDLSYEFSVKTELISNEVKRCVDYFNLMDDIIGASMAMLGNTVFVFAYNRSAFNELNIENFNIYQLNNKGIIHDKTQL